MLLNFSIKHTTIHLQYPWPLGAQQGKTLIEIKKSVLLKLVPAIFYQIFIFSSSDKPSKTMKNVFYFILKALFVVKKFKFLYFFAFSHCPVSKGQMEVE